MVKRIYRHYARQPLVAVAVLLFAAVLTVVLCHLQRSAQEEQRSYKETYASVPVLFSVVDLDGTKITDSGGIEGWVADLFTDRGMEPNLAPYVKEIHTRVSYVGTIKFGETDQNGFTIDQEKTTTVTGITSTYVAEELTEGWGGKIYWKDGYNESILATEEYICLVPEYLRDQEFLTITFEFTRRVDGAMQTRTCVVDFQVAGYYTDLGNVRIYCPYGVMVSVHGKLGASKTIEELTAVLNDNDALSELYETADEWFARPNPTGEKTKWGKYYHQYYPYALDIDDYLLRTLETNMKNSILLNNLASAVVFTLSAGAGFLTGFLVIRSRKREITLMRTMGASQKSIFTELALEQMLCIALGIVLGGSYGLWQPVLRLLLFGGIYFVGLTAALFVFLRKNLLSCAKEEE